MAFDFWEENEVAKHICIRLMRHEYGELRKDLQDAVLAAADLPEFELEEIFDQLARIFVHYRLSGYDVSAKLSEELKDLLIFRALADAASIRWRRALLEGPSLAKELIEERKAEARREI